MAIFRNYKETDYFALEQLLFSEDIAKNEIGIKRCGRETVVMTNKTGKIIGFFTVVLDKVPILIHFVINKSNRNGLNVLGYRLLQALVKYLKLNGFSKLILNDYPSIYNSTCRIIERYAEKKVFFKKLTIKDIGNRRFYLAEI